MTILSMNPRLIDKLVNGCYMTILSLSRVGNHNLVIVPWNHLQSCHWALGPFTGLIYCLQIRDQGSSVPDLGLVAVHPILLPIGGCSRLPRGLPNANLTWGMYIACIRGYIWIFGCFWGALFLQKLAIHCPCPGSWLHPKIAVKYSPFNANNHIFTCIYKMRKKYMQ